jgi:hypothetical protein
MITTLNKEKPWIFKCQSVFDYYEIGQRKIAGELIVTDITVDDKKPSHTNMKNNKNQMEM